MNEIGRTFCLNGNILAIPGILNHFENDFLIIALKNGAVLVNWTSWRTLKFNATVSIVV